MLAMLVLKKIMNTMKQFGKRDNVYQKPLDITQLSKNSSSRNAITNVFNATCITNHGVGQGGLECQKGWPHSL